MSKSSPCAQADRKVSTDDNDFCRGIVSVLLRGVPVGPTFPGCAVEADTGRVRASTGLVGEQIHEQRLVGYRRTLGHALMCLPIPGPRPRALTPQPQHGAKH